MLRKFAPLSDRVLVSRAVVAEKTAGGLYLPGADDKKSSEGLVEAVGPGLLMESGATAQMNLKVRGGGGRGDLVAAEEEQRLSRLFARHRC
jgi:co-chaperonin GroES (HSP10)